MTVASPNKVVLSLAPGKMWRKDVGFLRMSAIHKDGERFELANGDGIRLATVLENPSIYESDELFHETQSKVLVIRGKGFTNSIDTEVSVRPSGRGKYKVVSVSSDSIRLQLQPGASWLPSFLTLTDSDKQIPLQVASINTGAGEIFIFDPVTVGKVVQDRQGVECDDSCEFSFDGVCDDGSEERPAEGDSNLDTYEGGYYGGSYFGERDNAYDDYYMVDKEHTVSACLRGTDCSDCGGVDAVVAIQPPSELDEGEDSVGCTNTCPYARDGVCDDPRGSNYCVLGTDCQDCEKVGDTGDVDVPDNEPTNDGVTDDDDYGDVDVPDNGPAEPTEEGATDDEETILGTQPVGGSEENTHHGASISFGQLLGAAAACLALVTGLFVGRRLRMGRSTDANGPNIDVSPPADVESCSSGSVVEEDTATFSFPSQESDIGSGILKTLTDKFKEATGCEPTEEDVAKMLREMKERVAAEVLWGGKASTPLEINEVAALQQTQEGGLSVAH